MSFMKKLLLLALLLLPLFALEKVTLQLSWKHQFQFAGYYMAKEKGFYEAAGLDVTINEFSGDIDLYRSIDNGLTDYAVGRSSLLIDRANGKKVVGLGAIYQYSPMVLLVMEKSGIRTIGDLQGKRIMITPDAKETADVLAMLFSNGLSRHSFIMQPHSFDVRDLADGKTDAMAAYISNEPIWLDEQGLNHRIFQPKDYGFEFYNDILFTTEAYIAEHPGQTRRFYEATIKGWEYAFNHTAETAELIFKKYNSQDKTLIAIIEEAKALEPLAVCDVGIGHISRQKLEKIIDAYKLMGLIDTEVDIDGFIYEHNHPERYFLEFTVYELILIAAGLLVLSLLILAIFLLIGIRKRWLYTKNELVRTIDEQHAEIEQQNRIIMTQSKLAAVGEMLRNISHQWRQPLNVMTITAADIRIPLEMEEAIDKRRLQKNLDTIERNCAYLSETIDDFMHYFKDDTHAVENFDVAGALGTIIDLTRPMFDHNSIKLLPALDSVTLDNNEHLLIQAMINIFNNAKDAFEVNAIDKSRRYLFISLQRIGDKAVIVIKDSAGGVDKTHITDIFEPYFTTKHPSKGTGLGLYMTYEIIKEHYNGTIVVENQTFEYQGKTLTGAVFTITLPLN
jgi:signal transduction histidine kinase